MTTEFKIEIFMEPEKDIENMETSYFYCILGLDKKWYNTGICGSEATPELAWSKAFARYQACLYPNEGGR
jgi:hypothetical protein